MPFMRCPTCKHTDHATGTEALPCTNPNGCRGIMEPDPGRHGQVPRPAAEYGPSHLAERRAWQAEARARAEVNELAAATSGTPTNDSMDGRVVLPPAARAMLEATAAASITTDEEKARARAVLEAAPPTDAQGRSWVRPADGGPSPAGAALVAECEAREAARRHEALVGQNRDHCDERCPPPSATLEISVGGDRVDVREVSDDGAVPLATCADLEALELPEIAPPPARWGEAVQAIGPDGTATWVKVTPTDPAHPHLVDGEFQSDKYPTCPRGKVPLSCKDPHAQDLLWLYAQRHEPRDAQFSADLRMALDRAGFVPSPSVSTHDQVYEVGIREGQRRAKQHGAEAAGDLRRLEEALDELFPDTLNAAAGPPVDVAIELLRDMAKLRDTYREVSKPVTVTVDVKSDDPDRFAANVAQAFKDVFARAYPSVTLGDVRRAAMEAGAAACEVIAPSPTHEDGLRAGCLAAIEQVNTILDQLVEVADLCCEPDRTLGDPGEHQRAALIADVVRIVRRRLQDVGV